MRLAVLTVLMAACELQHPSSRCSYDADNTDILNCNVFGIDTANGQDAVETGIDGGTSTDQPTTPDAISDGGVADDRIDAATDLGSEGIIDTGAIVDSTNDTGALDSGFEAGADAGQDAQVDTTPIEDTSRVDILTDSTVETGVDAGIDATLDAGIDATLDAPIDIIQLDTATDTSGADVIRDTGTDRPDVVDASTHSDVGVPTDDGSTVAPECGEISFGGMVSRDMGGNYSTVENNRITLIFVGTPRCTVRNVTFTGTPTNTGAIGLSTTEIATGVETGTFTVPNVQVVGNDTTNGGPFSVSTTINCFEASRVINCRTQGVTRPISVRAL
ncbi:hypothetical protein KBB08_02930 [Candidatus Gracilibacteria bacterium]|nr:hypothetical protein [Candidatus Gracilibacteria bacterium]